MMSYRYSATLASTRTVSIRHGSTVPQRALLPAWSEALEPCQLSIRSIPAHDHCRPSTLTIGLASHAASSLAAIFVDRESARSCVLPAQEASSSASQLACTLTMRPLGQRTSKQRFQRSFVTLLVEPWVRLDSTTIACALRRRCSGVHSQPRLAWLSCAPSPSFCTAVTWRVASR